MMLELLTIYNGAYYFGSVVLVISILSLAWLSTRVPGRQNVTVVVLQNSSGRQQTLGHFTTTDNGITVENDGVEHIETFNDARFTAASDAEASEIETDEEIRTNNLSNVSESEQTTSDRSNENLTAAVVSSSTTSAETMASTAAQYAVSSVVTATAADSTTPTSSSVTDSTSAILAQNYIPQSISNVLSTTDTIFTNAGGSSSQLPINVSGSLSVRPKCYPSLNENSITSTTITTSTSKSAGNSISDSSVQPCNSKIAQLSISTANTVSSLKENTTDMLEDISLSNSASNSLQSEAASTNESKDIKDDGAAQSDKMWHWGCKDESNASRVENSHDADSKFDVANTESINSSITDDNNKSRIKQTPLDGQVKQNSAENSENVLRNVYTSNDEINLSCNLKSVSSGSSTAADVSGPSTSATNMSVSTSNMSKAPTTSALSGTSTTAASSEGSSITSTDASAAGKAATTTTTEPEGATTADAVVQTMPDLTTCPEGSIRIRLKFLDDVQRLVFGELTQNIICFKRKYFSKELDEHRVVRLIFKGQLLKQDSWTLAQYSLFDNCVVHCHVSQPKLPPAQPVPSATSGSSSSAARAGAAASVWQRMWRFVSHTADNLAEDGGDQTLDLSSYMTFLLWAIVVCLWIAHLKLSYMFSTFSTFMLVFLTLLLLVPHYIFPVDVQLDVNIEHLGVERVMLLEQFTAATLHGVDDTATLHGVTMHTETVVVHDDRQQTRAHDTGQDNGNNDGPVGQDGTGDTELATSDYDRGGGDDIVAAAGSCSDTITTTTAAGGSCTDTVATVTTSSGSHSNVSEASIAETIINTKNTDASVSNISNSSNITTSVHAEPSSGNDSSSSSNKTASVEARIRCVASGAAVSDDQLGADEIASSAKDATTSPLNQQDISDTCLQSDGVVRRRNK